MPMAGVNAGRSRRRADPQASIRVTPGRQERRSFNNFPAIAAAFPDVLSEIVIATTEWIGAAAAARAPVEAVQRPGDPKPGTLRRSMRTRFFRRKGSDLVVTGRITFGAKDPRGHRYARPVEHLDPYLVPTVIEAREIFVEQVQSLEARLPKGPR